MSLEASFNAAPHRWRIEREVGRGGQCSVFLGADRRTQQPTAIKVMHPLADPAENAEMRLTFLSSAARLRYLRPHPNIVELYGDGEHAYNGWDLLYMATEYVPDGSLARRMEDVPTDQLLPLREAVSCIGQIAYGMAAAHGREPGDIRLVHRDLKPANILISRHEPFHGLPGMPDLNGQGGVFKVSDFDASILGQSLESATAAQIPIGTLPYMPPEQAAGRAVFASDVYALGVMAYELLAGRRPVVVNTLGMTALQMSTSWNHAHTHQHIPAIEDIRPRPNMNEVVEAVQVPIHTALSKRARDRQTNMGEFYDEFAAAFRYGVAAYYKNRS
jgi:serine/threonine-protein kinase